VVDASSPVDPEMLEKLRRGFPLEMDASGRFYFEGDPLTHPRLVNFFRNSLDRSPDGDVLLRVGEQFVYLRVHDLPLRVRAVEADEQDAPVLLLDDGRRCPLHPDSLWEEPERGLRCDVPARESGRPLGARFSNRGQAELSRWIVWEDGEPRPALIIGGRRITIPTSPL
jgi:hypothetical protein